MLKPKFDVQSMRVASPCSVGWDQMTGDDRVRHCDSCLLNIYNTAEMTVKEIKTLIRNREGRLCIRLYRRADGTVLTKDCPVDLRAFQRRIARFAGACAATIISIVSFSYGQQRKSAAASQPVVWERNKSPTSETSVVGTVMDLNDALVAGAKVMLFQTRDSGKNGKRRHLRELATDGEGAFAFRGLPEGIYEIEVQAQGFRRAVVTNIKTNPEKQTQIKISLEVGDKNVVVGIFSDSEPLIDMSKSSITTIIRGRKID